MIRKLVMAILVGGVFAAGGFSGAGADHLSIGGIGEGAVGLHDGLAGRHHGTPGVHDRRFDHETVRRRADPDFVTRATRDDDPELFGSGPLNFTARDLAREAERLERERKLKPKRRFDRRVFVPFVHHLHDDDDEDEVNVTVQIVQPPEPEPEPQPEPLDARGPEWKAARGRSPGGAADIGVGEPLPDVPHVALDWREYDLPRPPAGEGYVRLGDTVLRIDTGSRVVTEVMAPSEG